MPTTERDPAPLENDPLAPVPRLKPDSQRLQARFKVVMEGSATAIQRLLRSLENEHRIIFAGVDTVEVALGTKELADAASESEETENSLTPDELKHVVQEALEIIYSEGLDTPDAHLEYCRRQLRAAVA